MAYFLRTKGIRHNTYRTFDSDSVTYNEMGEIEVQDTNLPPLNDGFYDWWVEAQDKANLIEFSDTNTFGVDASPPDISHTPINTIDEGTNSPTIDAQFFDVASGVKDAFLHYRRSGSGFDLQK